jgi:hypothetical protein
VPPAVQVQTETPPQRQGSFMMGALFSGGLALVGALAWWGIAAITDRELGLIAWGVGLLAGAGMAAGYRNKTAGGGVLAAFMAVAGIVVGKILIFSTIVLPTVLNLSSAGDENDPDVLRDRVEYHLTLKNLEGKGISPDDATDKQWSDAGSAAEERVSQMSEDELARAGRDAKAYQDEENLVSDVAEDLLAQRGAEDEDNFMALTLVEREAREKVKAMTPDERAARLAAIEQEQDAVTEVGGALQVIVVGGVFVVTMFGLMDIVFVLLAIFSAFKVASGATS